MDRRARVLEWIQTNPDLPTPPAVALQVIDRASEPNCRPEELAAIVSQDPALCARLLRTVNSVLYGLRQPVTSVSGAVRYLGINPLRSLVLSLSLPNVRRPKLPAEILRTYWRVSVAGALAARELARRCHRLCPESELVAGLVRDLGVLVLHQLHPEAYRTLLEVGPEVLAEYQCDLEEQALQINHAEVSAELLKNWRFPEETTEPIRFHHNWDQCNRMQGEQRERARLLYFASQLGQLQLTPSHPTLVAEVLRLAGQFGMTELQLRGFLGSLQVQMEEFAQLLQVDIGDCFAYGDILSRGAEELTRLTLQAGLNASQGGAGPASQACPVSPGAIAATGEWTPAVRQPTWDGAGVRSRPTSSTPRLATRPARSIPSVGQASLDGLLQRILLGPGSPGILGFLDSYEVNDLIGSGGMGAVFRGRDPQLNRPVAIKLLLPRFADNPLARQRFAQEGRAIAALSHDNIVGVYGVGEAEGIPYLVMEFVAGMSLADRLIEAAPLPLAEVIRIGLQTASGLAAAHAAGLVHRDVKPANLLLQEGTRKIKITDFGLAKVIDQVSNSQEGALVGTPHFMSPEQADGKPAEPRSDLFALGAILYTACTGHLPFDGDNLLAILRSICETEPLPVRQLNPQLPDWLEELLCQLLDKRPERRITSAAELKRILILRWATLHTSGRNSLSLPAPTRNGSRPR